MVPHSVLSLTDIRPGLGPSGKRGKFFTGNPALWLECPRVRNGRTSNLRLHLPTRFRSGKPVAGIQYQRSVGFILRENRVRTNLRIREDVIRICGNVGICGNARSCCKTRLLGTSKTRPLRKMYVYPAPWMARWVTVRRATPCGHNLDESLETFEEGGETPTALLGRE